MLTCLSALKTLNQMWSSLIIDGPSSVWNGAYIYAPCLHDHTFDLILIQGLRKQQQNSLGLTYVGMTSAKWIKHRVTLRKWIAWLIKTDLLGFNICNRLQNYQHRPICHLVRILILCNCMKVIDPWTGYTRKND